MLAGARPTLQCHDNHNRKRENSRIAKGKGPTKSQTHKVHIVANSSGRRPMAQPCCLGRKEVVQCTVWGHGTRSRRAAPVSHRPRFCRWRHCNALCLCSCTGTSSKVGLRTERCCRFLGGLLGHFERRRHQRGPRASVGFRISAASSSRAASARCEERGPLRRLGLPGTRCRLGLSIDPRQLLRPTPHIDDTRPSPI